MSETPSEPSTSGKRETMKRLKAVGFWRSPTECLIVWPHPKELVRDWENDEKNKVVEYLCSGVIINEQFGYGEPRFSDIKDPTKLGCGEQTDGEWLWPESLPFYISNYDVRIPQELIDKALAESSGHENEENTDYENMEYDFELWNSWCQKNRKNKLLAGLAMIFLCFR